MCAQSLPASLISLRYDVTREYVTCAQKLTRSHFNLPSEAKKIMKQKTKKKLKHPQNSPRVSEVRQQMKPQCAKDMGPISHVMIVPSLNSQSPGLQPGYYQKPETITKMTTMSCLFTGYRNS